VAVDLSDAIVKKTGPVAGLFSTIDDRNRINLDQIAGR
jgi:hypothetical protein